MKIHYKATIIKIAVIDESQTHWPWEQNGECRNKFVYSFKYGI